LSYDTPKQYTLSKLSLVTNEGKSISVMQILDTISVVEDIYVNFLHGVLTISDSNDLHQIAPLIGEETIQMTYQTDAESANQIYREFRVYRVESSSDNTNDRLAHRLYFASKEVFEDSNNLLSKSYKNKPISFIVRDAFAYLNSNKRLTISEMGGKYHIISPNWSPFQLINYCTSIAIPKNYDSSMVLFYENSNGFNFTHLEELLAQPIVGTWVASDAKNRDKDIAKDQINPSNNIIEYRILKNSVDTLKSMGEGLYRNAVISYDNIAKTYQINGYEYGKDFEKTQHLSGFKLNSENFEYNSISQKLTYVPTTSFRYDSKYVKSKMGNVNYSERKEMVIPSRTSLLSQISAKQLELDVAGDNRLVAGRTIKIEIPNITALDNIKNNKHRYNAKKVLITSITNTFGQKTHAMTLRVADDSYTEDLVAHPEFDKVANNV
jgi:hypothetical protein